MATKSVLKNIKIVDKKIASAFAKALSETQNAKHKEVPLTRKCTEIKGDKIKEFFGNR